MEEATRLSRRKLLLALGAITVGGVGGARILRSDDPAIDLATAPDPLPSERERIEPAAPEPTPEPTAEPTPEPTVEPEPAIDVPEPAPPYELVGGEVYGEAKLLAAAVAQGVTTYEPGEDPAEVVARSLVRPAADIDLGAAVEVAGALVDPALASRGRAIYPQLGGLAPADDGALRCSIMVVTEQLLRDAEGERVVIRTIDVRLSGDGATWWLEGIASTGGTEISRPADLPGLADAVLDDPRIELPDSARWDIYAGVVDHRLLETMLAIAERTPYSVTSLRNGHPIRVFGTERASNHAHGRAVDIWRVGEHAVVSQQPDEGTAAWDSNRWLYDAGHVEELGGPWSFDGRGGRSFTNDVHLDHLHVAFHHPRRPDPDVPPEEAAPAPEDESG